MEKVYLFNSAVPYKWVREAFGKAIEEYLPYKKEIENVRDWENYLSYLAKFEKPCVVDRDSNVYLREIPTYLDFHLISSEVFLYLYDGKDEVKRNLMVSGDYPIHGVVIPPEVSDRNDLIVEGLVKFIKIVVDLHIAYENL